MPSVLVIGDVMTDIVVRPVGAVAVGADRRATIRQLSGGSGANQACWLASEGIDVRFVGRVGRGDLDRQSREFAAYAIDARLGADDALPTGSLVALLSPDGERSFLTDRGANEALCRADLPASLLDCVDLVHVSAYALFSAGPRGAVFELLREARSRAIPFSVDPSSYSFIAEAGPYEFMAWAQGATLFFPNADEAAILAGTADPDAQLDALTRHHRVVAIKRGAAGAVAADSADGVHHVVRAPTLDVVDTSGAGDAFLGGFLASYLRSEGIEAALARGVARGSAAVTVLGARPPLDPSAARRP